VGSRGLFCQHAHYGRSRRIGHFALLLCYRLRGKEACCSPKYWLELEEEQKSSEQEPHEAKSISQAIESQAACRSEQSSTASEVPAYLLAATFTESLRRLE
jgi:hypothetical protein